MPGCFRKFERVYRIPPATGKKFAYFSEVHDDADAKKLDIEFDIVGRTDYRQPFFGPIASISFVELQATRMSSLSRFGTWRIWRSRYRYVGFVDGIPLLLKNPKSKT